MDIGLVTTAAAKGAIPAITKLSTVLRAAVGKKHLTALQRAVREGVTAALAEPVAKASDADQEQLIAFLQSPAFSDACYHMFLIQVAGGATPTTEQDLRLLVRGHLQFFVSAEQAGYWAPFVAAALAQAAESVVTSDSFRLLIPEARLKSEAHNRVIEQLLSGIAHRLDVLDRVIASTTKVEIDNFEKRYRAQVQARYRKITPPNFGTPRSVPFSRVYVAPTVTAGESTITLGDFISRLYRTVVVGDPGGGKTTLATKLILDASSATGLYGRRDALIPFIVTLREYAARKQTTPMAIVEYIEETLRSRYQIPDAPSNVVKFFLATGRALLVFDGLDELIDTTQRQEVVEDVELFCSLYSTTPALVTSRAVGYGEAPLDQQVFELYKLAKFNETQVAEYVKKWFANAPDLATEERSALPTLFVQESEAVPDLTSNPLMLSLMCNLYRGERYIPRNRPELYEKCAEMLFERWDKNRKIVVPLPIEEHVRPAMMAIAYQIFETPRLQEGVPRGQLESMATSYLLAAKYDDEGRARGVAAKFIEFCTGRAWVFTNTGSTGFEELYQFTHRTFLEYFAASHLARTCRTPADLLAVLLPHVALAEWDVVSQLAVQIMARRLDGAADEMVELALQYETDAPARQKCNVLSFTVRCLAFLVPREATVRKLIIRAAAVALDRSVFDDVAEVTYHRTPRASTYSPASFLGTVCSVAAENHDPTCSALRAVLSPAVDAADPVALDLCCSKLSFGQHDPRRTPFDPNWVGTISALLDSLVDSGETRRKAALLRRRLGALYAFEAGSISASEYVAAQGFRNCLLPFRDSATLDWQPPEGYHFLRDPSDERWSAWASAALERLARSGPPWFEVGPYLGAFVEFIPAGRNRRASGEGATQFDARVELMRVLLAVSIFEGLVLFHSGAFLQLGDNREAEVGLSVVGTLVVLMKDSDVGYFPPDAGPFVERASAVQSLSVMSERLRAIDRLPSHFEPARDVVNEALEKVQRLLPQTPLRSGNQRRGRPRPSAPRKG